MNDNIAKILSQMAALEEELRTAVQEQESKMFFVIKGKRVEFESTVKAAHRKLKNNFFRWLVTNRPQNLITGPIIYSMIFPMMLFDLFVSFYSSPAFLYTASPRSNALITWFSIVITWVISTLSRSFTARTANMATA